MVCISFEPVFTQISDKLLRTRTFSLNVLIKSYTSHDVVQHLSDKLWMNVLWIFFLWLSPVCFQSVVSSSCFVVSLFGQYNCSFILSLFHSFLSLFLLFVCLFKVSFVLIINFTKFFSHSWLDFYCVCLSDILIYFKPFFFLSFLYFLVGYLYIYV